MSGGLDTHQQGCEDTKSRNRCEFVLKKKSFLNTWLIVPLAVLQKARAVTRDEVSFCLPIRADQCDCIPESDRQLVRMKYLSSRDLYLEKFS